MELTNGSAAEWAATTAISTILPVGRNDITKKGSVWIYGAGICRSCRLSPFSQLQMQFNQKSTRLTPPMQVVRSTNDALTQFAAYKCAFCGLMMSASLALNSVAMRRMSFS
jgi:hypothetical protein